jgi:Fanconi anemia group M protein
MKALHALELIESQGVEALREFLVRQDGTPGRRVTPAQRTFLRDPDVQEVRHQLDRIDLEHPKVAVAVGLVRQEFTARPDGRVIVFAQYRQTAELLVSELQRLGDARVRPARFVGQASRGSDEGLTQKEQVARLEEFRNGTVNCLVATSVGEEGLDIPLTDLVIFYEPVPDVIRTIQRRGRTGRVSAGRVIVLVAEGTRDVGLHYAARSRERRMHEMLEQVEGEFRHGRVTPPVHRTVQQSLREFEQ